MPTQILKTVKPSGGDYTTLSAALTAQSQNLVSGDKYLTIQIDGDWTGVTDTSVISLGNYTMDATHYVEIYTVVGPARHNGIYKNKASAYSLEASNDSNACFRIEGSNSGAYVKITGLQIKNTYSSNQYDASGGIGIGYDNSNSKIQIDSCIIYSPAACVSSGYDTNFFVTNCLLVMTGASGHAGGTVCYSNGGMYVANCVLINRNASATGPCVSVGTYNGDVVNCYAYNAGSGACYGSNLQLSKCASSDGTGSSGLTSMAYSTTAGVYFTSITAGSENVSPQGSSLLKGVGLDLSNTIGTDTTDNFTRANESPLSGWTGINGEISTNNLQVVSNQCVGTSTGFSSANMMVKNNAHGADAKAFCNVATKCTATNDCIWLFVRFNTNRESGYFVKYTRNTGGTDTIAIGYTYYPNSAWTGGVTTLATYNQNVANGDSFGITAIGSTIQAWYRSGSGSWTSLGSVSDSSSNGSGYTTLGMQYATTTPAVSGFGFAPVFGYTNDLIQDTRSDPWDAGAIAATFSSSSSSCRSSSSSSCSSSSSSRSSSSSSSSKSSSSSLSSSSSSSRSSSSSSSSSSRSSSSSSSSSSSKSSSSSSRSSSSSSSSSSCRSSSSSSSSSKSSSSSSSSFSRSSSSSSSSCRSSSSSSSSCSSSSSSSSRSSSSSSSSSRSSSSSSCRSSSSCSSSSSALTGTTKDYSRQDVSVLPTDNTDLATLFSPTDYTAVLILDGVRVPQVSILGDAVFLFKDQYPSKIPFTVTWVGQSNKPTTTAPIYLQIYNINTLLWETMASDTTTPANTNITLTGSKLSTIANYFDTNNIVSCRVYQPNV